MNPSINKSYLVLRTIYFALIAGIVLFTLVTLFLNDMRIPEIQEGFDPLNLVSVVLILMIPAGKMISDKQIQAISESDSLESRIARLQKAMIIRWAWIEGPAIFSTVVFMILQDAKQLLLFLVCLVAFILAYPSKPKVAESLKLNEDERREFQ